MENMYLQRERKTACCDPEAKRGLKMFSLWRKNKGLATSCPKAGEKLRAISWKAQGTVCHRMDKELQTQKKKQNLKVKMVQTDAALTHSLTGHRVAGGSFTHATLQLHSQARKVFLTSGLSCRSILLSVNPHVSHHFTISPLYLFHFLCVRVSTPDWTLKLKVWPAVNVFFLPALSFFPLKCACCDRCWNLLPGDTLNHTHFSISVAERRGRDCYGCVYTSKSISPPGVTCLKQQHSLGAWNSVSILKISFELRAPLDCIKATQTLLPALLLDDQSLSSAETFISSCFVSHKSHTSGEETEEGKASGKSKPASFQKHQTHIFIFPPDRNLCTMILQL